MEIFVKWNKVTYKIEDLTDDSTILDLKLKLFNKTLVLPARQKIMGFKGITNLTDDTTFSHLKVKPGLKIMMMGTNDELEELVHNDDIIDDMDEVYAEDIALFEREEYLSKIKNRVDNYKIEVWEPPRAGKNLLVLDIDGTIFDNKSYAERGIELMRPYLHQFLAQAYKTFDIVIWYHFPGPSLILRITDYDRFIKIVAATSLKYIQAKVHHLKLLNNGEYKISFLLDHAAMISVYTQEKGLTDVKPLGLLWGKFSAFYNPKNSIIVDDCGRNFLMNPQNGLKICAYQNSHVTRRTDEDLLWLAHYLDSISQSHGSDFTTLNHKRWKRYIKRVKKECDIKGEDTSL